MSSLPAKVRRIITGGQMFAGTFLVPPALTMGFTEKGLKNNKAFLGLHDLVDWAVGQVRSETNSVGPTLNIP